MIWLTIGRDCGAREMIAWEAIGIAVDPYRSGKRGRGTLPAIAFARVKFCERVRANCENQVARPAFGYSLEAALIVRSVGCPSQPAWRLGARRKSR